MDLKINQATSNGLFGKDVPYWSGVNLIGCNGVKVGHEDEMPYHSDLNWLMPVVDKISKLGYHVLMSQGSIWKTYCNISTGLGIKNSSLENPSKFSHTEDTLILAVYKCVVEFIQWYNNLEK